MSVTRHMPDDSPVPTGSACPGYPLGVWPPLLSAFCVDPSNTNERHSDCSVPGCICPCHKPRNSPPTWEWESGRAVAIHDFNPQGKSVDLMERLARLGSNRASTKVFSR